MNNKIVLYIKLIKKLKIIEIMKKMNETEEKNKDTFNKVLLIYLTKRFYLTMMEISLKKKIL